MLLACCINNRAVPRIGRRTSAYHRDPVRIRVVHLILAEGSEAAGDHFDKRLGIDADWPAAIVACPPLRDVEMMRAPIGHRAARILPPITKSHMAPLGH